MLTSALVNALEGNVPKSIFIPTCALIALCSLALHAQTNPAGAQQPTQKYPVVILRPNVKNLRVSPPRSLPLAMPALSGNASPSPLTNAVMGFDQLQCLEYVDNYYAGGNGSMGTGPGPNYGITFSANTEINVNYAVDGTCTNWISNTTNEPSPYNNVIFLSGSAATMDVPAGFTGGFSFYYSAPYNTGFINVWSGLDGTGTLLATLNLPVTPGCSSTPNYCDWVPIGVSFPGTAMSVDFGGTENYIAFDNITLGVPVVVNPAKALGSCSDLPGTPQCGDPINLGNGNVYEHVTDYQTSGPNRLMFERHYNSLGDTASLATSLGTKWRLTYDRYLRILSASTVTAERADGQEVNFNLVGSTWTPDSDVDMTLVNSGSTWTLTDQSDTVETYTAISSSEALLQSIQARNGYTQNLAYNSSNQLISVTDSYNRTLTFTYLNGLLNTVTTPDGLVITYGFTVAGSQNLLTSVTYSTTPATSQTYLYGDSTLPSALTGIVDEDGNQYATWTYDSSGRALTSQRANGADLTTVVYNDSDGTRTVTNALGVTDTYTFATLQGVPKVTQISRAATATEAFTYDSNGYLASKTDWNGNQTTYVNNSHGLPTTINEAVGTNAARTTTITYDSTWVHLPASIVTPGLTTSFTYDSHGEVLTKILTDKTTNSAPYSTSGTSRTWSYTWSNALMSSIKTPNGNLTQFGYDGSGTLKSITDAKGHVTNIASHTPGGYPETIVDPNGVTTTLTYSPRLWLMSRTVDGGTGQYQTSWSYDAAGNLIQTTMPDGSYLANQYDNAHRLVQVTNALGDYISYTLDALGDRTQTAVYAVNGASPVWQRTNTFDALGRLLVDTEGAGQSKTLTYDPNGNTLSITDGLNHTTTKTYDALNRPISTTDARGGVTTVSYDEHNRVVSVKDANGNQTSYVRNGFGDVIQQASPDSGTTVYQYDGDANLTQKADALGIVLNQTFDSLDRVLTTTYPADTAENVSYTYDQNGAGFSFGVGRLTSVTDAAGTMSRSYDERGNLQSETRINGTNTLTTGYTYDGANRVASIAYPDGTVVNYQRDAAGYVSSVTAKPSGSSTTTTIATIHHQPFGPMNGATFGNGIAETWTYDQSYRPIQITDVLAGTNVQNLAYTYDAANNVTSIADSVNAANSQAFTYDPLNRLTGATSGTGGYGSLMWTYDPVGNRLTQVQGSTTYTYLYESSSNRMASITITNTTAQLNKIPGAGEINISKPVLLAAVPPKSLRRTDKAHSNRRPKEPSNMLAVLFGWPILLIGFGGIIRFRKRLSDQKLLVILFCVALVTGTGILVNGCGSNSGGSNGSSGGSTPQAATPAISPATGTYTSVQTVTISDSTPGATIYYTVDGSTPTLTSTKYTSALSISSTETVKAMAAASGYTNSTVATAVFTMNITTVISVVTNANGNITSIPPAGSVTNATFAYNNANRLASVTGSPLAATFVYDWQGKRITKTKPGAAGPIVYSYGQDGTLISENNAGTVTDYIYVDGRPVAVLNPSDSQSADQVSYIIADRMGTPQLASNSGGSTVWETNYQPFGTTSNISGSIVQNLRFPGQYYDVETGFNYNWNRDYIASVGRYLQVDPLFSQRPGQRSIQPIPITSEYQYALSNPIEYMDLSGLLVGWINAGADAASAYQTGPQWQSEYQQELQCAEDTASGCTLSDQQVNGTSNLEVQGLHSLQSAGSEAGSELYSGSNVMGAGPGADAFNLWQFLDITQTMKNLSALPGKLIQLFAPKANAADIPGASTCIVNN